MLLLFLQVVLCLPLEYEERKEDFYMINFKAKNFQLDFCDTLLAAILDPSLVRSTNIVVIYTHKL